MGMHPILSAHAPAVEPSESGATGALYGHAIAEAYHVASQVPLLIRPHPGLCLMLGPVKQVFGRCHLTSGLRRREECISNDILFQVPLFQAMVMISWLLSHLRVQHDLGKIVSSL